MCALCGRIKLPLCLKMRCTGRSSWHIVNCTDKSIFTMLLIDCLQLQPEHVSGAENGAERAESRVERSVRGTKRWSESRAQSGRSRCRNGAGSELNRPFTACSNLTFHSTDFIVYIVCIELSAVILFQSPFFYYRVTSPRILESPLKYYNFSPKFKALKVFETRCSAIAERPRCRVH